MKMRTTFAVAVALTLVTLAPQATGASGTPITSCGQVVTTNAYMVGDLYCPSATGVIVGASGITIDLKGHKLRGNVTTTYVPSYSGVWNDGYDEVTVKNGAVSQFVYGIYGFNGADSFRVSNIVASGNLTGVNITGNSASVKSTTVAGNVGSGVELTGNGALISSSTASGNQFWGFSVEGNAAKVQSSTASGNVVWGVRVFGDAATIKGNTADGNGFNDQGFVAGGIAAAGYTTAPVGKNTARGNNVPTECSPTFLC